MTDVETMVWMHHCGKAQSRMTAWIHEQQRRMAQLQSQLLRLRAQRVLEHTQRLWGLSQGSAWVSEAALMRSGEAGCCERGRRRCTGCGARGAGRVARGMKWPGR